MIIVGYQGIGKSSISSANTGYIDLESGNFWVNGKRADDWYKPYCQIAEHLSQQGYNVFTSSHKVVRDELQRSTESKLIVCPSLDLEDEWIERLHQRYMTTKLNKDYKSLRNAEDCYAENIQELMDTPNFEKLIITSMNYDLLHLLNFRDI